MTQRTLRTVFTGANETRYADPQNLSSTLRVLHQAQAKMAGDIRVTNARTETITQRTNVAVPETDPNCISKSRTEALSVRVVVSGSIENKDQVLAMFEDAVHNTRIVLNDTSIGFPPASDAVLVVNLEPAAE